VKAALFTLALLLVGHAPAVRAQVALPPLEARVTDLTGTLTAAHQSALEEKLAAFERRKGAQIAVLILSTTEPEDIAQYGIRLAEAWKIGRAEPDDGAILIVAKEDRAMRIEVGRGLEGVLTDVTSSRIINDTIAPLFKQGDFNGGVNAGLDQMIRVIDGEALPEADQAWKREEPTRLLPFPILLMVGMVLVTFLRGTIGKAPAAGVIGLGGAGYAYWATSQLLWSIGAGVGVFLLALIVGFGVGSPYGGRGGRVFRDIGRMGGGGSRGGGFRGGGGSFGGGGASGRW
jgi:uncharacterized protein